MPLTDAQIADMSRDVLEAERARTPIANFTERHLDMTVDDAYAVQLRSLRTRLADGQVIVGRKIGLCAKAVQEMMGIHEPIYGHLFDPMLVQAFLNRPGLMAGRSLS